MKKSVTLLVLVVFATVCFASCSADDEKTPDDAISVYCPQNVEYIMPGDYPIYNAEDAEALKWGYNVFVSKLNGDDKLVLSANRNEGLKRTSKTYSGNYYQSGEWFGYKGGVYLGSEKVIAEECVGMVASWFDDSALLIVTNTDDNSYVYSAAFVDGQWELNKDKKIELGSKTKFVFYDWQLYPSMTCPPPNTMYIITEKNLVELSVGDYLDGKRGDFHSVTKTVTETPEYWHYLKITSAVELNGKLYFGDRFGVVEFSADTQAFTYYPADLRSMR